MDSSSISSDLIRGHIDTIILKTLLVNDKCANDIMKDIEERTNGQYALKQATLYSALKRLETLKMVKPYWSDSPDGGRRRYFQLTNDGKALVNDNLKDWNYSKSILDLLIADVDASKVQSPTQPLTQTVQNFNSAPAEIKKEVVLEQYKNVQEVEVKKEKLETVVVNDKNLEKPIFVKNESEEINFRQVLNDIIKSSNIVDVAEKNTAQAEETQTVNVKPLEDKKVHIDDVKITYTGYDKVDYSDIVDKSLQEGFTVRFANRPQKKQGGTYVNKISLIAAFITFFVMLLEIFVVSKTNTDYISNSQAWLFVLAPVLFLTGIFMLSYKNIAKTGNKAFKSHMWTALVVAINLSLLTLAIALLANVDFLNSKNLLFYIIIPCVIYFDIFIYYGVKFLLSNVKKLNVA